MTIGCVIRSHLHIENLLIQFISKTPSKSLVNRSFSKKLQQAIKLHLRSDIEKPLILINQVRNSFAHEIEATLDMIKVHELYNSLSNNLINGINLSYLSSKKASFDKASFDIEKISSKDLWVLIILNCHEAIRAEIINKHV